MLRLSRTKLLDYFFTPKTPSFAALATRNLTTVLAGILIFCCVFGLKPVRAFLFLLHQLAKSGQDKFAVLLNLFIGKRAKSFQEHSRGSFVGLGGFGKCTLEFGLGHFVAVGLCQKPVTRVHPSSLKTQKNRVGNPPLFPPPPFREFIRKEPST
jgi:hypothetical protein